MHILHETNTHKTEGEGDRKSEKVKVNSVNVVISTRGSGQGRHLLGFDGKLKLQLPWKYASARHSQKSTQHAASFWQVHQLIISRAAAECDHFVAITAPFSIQICPK
jgi:hypothetical protein